MSESVTSCCLRIPKCQLLGCRCSDGGHCSDGSRLTLALHPHYLTVRIVTVLTNQLIIIIIINIINIISFRSWIYSPCICIMLNCEALLNFVCHKRWLYSVGDVWHTTKWPILHISQCKWSIEQRSAGVMRSGRFEYLSVYRTSRATSPDATRKRRMLVYSYLIVEGSTWNIPVWEVERGSKTLILCLDRWMLCINTNILSGIASHLPLVAIYWNPKLSVCSSISFHINTVRLFPTKTSPPSNQAVLKRSTNRIFYLCILTNLSVNWKHIYTQYGPISGHLDHGNRQHPTLIVLVYIFIFIYKWKPKCHILPVFCSEGCLCVDWCSADVRYNIFTVTWDVRLTIKRLWMNK